MSANYTPGPWRIEEGTTLVWGNCNAGDMTNWGMGYPIAVASISPSGRWAAGPDVEQGEANARLISAAPDLLDAAKAFIAKIYPAILVETDLGMSELADELRAAIDAVSKAEGRS